MTPEEFTAVEKEWSREKEDEMRGEWERMRMLAVVSIQPHTKRKITADRLIPLPWDKKKRNDDAPKLTPEQRRARMEYMRDKLG